MTLDEFYVELEKTKKLFSWHIEENRIRGTCNIDPDISNFCPLTGVLYNKYWALVEVYNASTAGMLLQIPDEDIPRIIFSADGAYAVEFSGEIRKKMEEILFGGEK